MEEITLIKKSVIKKLETIFKQGYIPTRGFETYEYIPTKSYWPTGSLANCFTHACFNLLNEHFEKFDIKLDEFNSLRNLELDKKSIEQIREELFEVISAAGLKFQKCDVDTPTLPNQWKVAYYFDMGEQTDYHFLLQEKDGTWSDKLATTKQVRSYETPPKSIFHSSDSSYYLQGFYLITNPFAQIKPEPAIGL